MTEENDARIERIHEFLDQVDHRLGALGEEEVQALFLEFSETTQPWLMDLLAAIEEARQLEPGFLGEAAFYVYALQRFYVEVLDLPPSPVEREVLLDAVDRVDILLDKLTGEQTPADLTGLDLPCLQIEVPGLFFIAWLECLDNLVEEGSVDPELRWDLARYFLVVLTTFGDQFPAAHM